MPSTWKWKTTGLALMIILSLYSLVPSWLGVKEHKALIEQDGGEAPWYYKFLPEKELNLGLDLRGGLYLEMIVGVEEALIHQVDSIAGDIRRFILDDEKFKDVKLSQIPGYVLRVEIPADQVADFESELVGYFGPDRVVLKRRLQELIYKVDSQTASETRKKVIKAFQGAKGLDLNANVNVTLLSTGDRLAVSFKKLDGNTRSEVQTVISANESLGLSKEPLTREEISDVFYLHLSDAYVTQLETSVIEQSANSVRNRIDRFGVAEASVSRQSTDRLVVELPGAKNPDRIIDIIRRTGKLEFRLVDDKISSNELQALVDKTILENKIDETKLVSEENTKKINQLLKADLPEKSEVVFQVQRDRRTGKAFRPVAYLVEKKSDVTGDMLENAVVQVDNGLPIVSMTFNKTGAQKFGELTSQNINRQLAIVLDGILTTAPVIRSAITGGRAQIELGYGSFHELQKEAGEIVLVLKEGALPASLKVGTKNIIGPSLGEESIRAGMTSLVFAAIAILIFMLVYYKMGGFIANIALIVNVIFIFAALCAFQASLTLPGIAGIVLTLGMAVDANVIIFERMREERFLGQEPASVVESGYGNAMSAIIDGNITTFIAGLVLFQFGTGPIKGFATTLMVGILTSLITAIVLTRLFYDYMVYKMRVKKLWI